MGDSYIFLVIQILLIIGLFFVVVYLIKIKNSLALEKRITRFSTESLIDRPLSFFDKLNEKYNNLISKITKSLSKSKILTKYSLRYDKYLDKTKIIKDKAMDIVSNKVLISVIALSVTIVSDVLRGQHLSALQVILSLLVGFFIPDVFLVINEKRKRKQIEEDLFKAVLIMSNAFKSGRSIMQAVEIVSQELDGPISEEFKKMYIDLKPKN